MVHFDNFQIWLVIAIMLDVQKAMNNKFMFFEPYLHMVKNG